MSRELPKHAISPSTRRAGETDRSGILPSPGNSNPDASRRASSLQVATNSDELESDTHESLGPSQVPYPDSYAPRQASYLRLVTNVDELESDTHEGLGPLRVTNPDPIEEQEEDESRNREEVESQRSREDAERTQRTDSKVEEEKSYENDNEEGERLQRPPTRRGTRGMEGEEPDSDETIQTGSAEHEGKATSDDGSDKTVSLDELEDVGYPLERSPTKFQLEWSETIPSSIQGISVACEDVGEEASGATTPERHEEALDEGVSLESEHVEHVDQGPGDASREESHEVLDEGAWFGRGRSQRRTSSEVDMAIRRRRVLPKPLQRVLRELRKYGDGSERSTSQPRSYIKIGEAAESGSLRHLRPPRRSATVDQQQQEGQTDGFDEATSQLIVYHRRIYERHGNTGSQAQRIASEALGRLLVEAPVPIESQSIPILEFDHREAPRVLPPAAAPTPTPTPTPDPESEQQQNPDTPDFQHAVSRIPGIAPDTNEWTRQCFDPPSTDPGPPPAEFPILSEPQSQTEEEKEEREEEDPNLYGPGDRKGKTPQYRIRGGFHTPSSRRTHCKRCTRPRIPRRRRLRVRHSKFSAMNNYFNSGDMANSVPRQAPSPGPQHQTNGIGGNTMANLNNSVLPAGQQADMNHLWGVVEQLSQVLAENRAQTAGIVNSVQQIQSHAAANGTSPTIDTLNHDFQNSGATAQLQNSNSTAPSTTTTPAQQLSQLTREFTQLQHAHASLQHSHASLLALLTQHETLLDTHILPQLRRYAHSHTLALTSLHAHYQKLLEDERQQNLELRLEHQKWQEGLGRVSRWARLALRESGEQEGRRKERERLGKLKEENRVLRGLVGWEERGDESEEDEDGRGMEGDGRGSVGDGSELR